MAASLVKSNRNIPKYVTVEQGKKYYWCACGLSKKQPFCDGSHKSAPELGLKPVEWVAPLNKK